jgi:1,4-dihydroxy-2-naphthoyl-CoA hydrolase
MSKFIHRSRIYLHHTDAAGRLFFANQFYLVHEAKEHFLLSLGVPLRTFLDHPEATFPIVHAEADFKAVLLAGDEVDIAVSVENIGETSVTFSFILTRPDGELAGTAKTVSVAVDKRTRKKIPVPQEWIKILKTAV